MTEMKIMNSTDMKIRGKNQDESFSRRNGPDGKRHSKKPTGPVKKIIFRKQAQWSC